MSGVPEAPFERVPWQLGKWTLVSNLGCVQDAYHVLAVAPGRVSLLTTSAWIFGSHPVGP